MRATTLKQIPETQFFARLSCDSLLEGFVRYLAVRIADQHHVIANLVTADSAQWLGQTLLQLARTMGKKDPRSIRIELRFPMKNSPRWWVRHGLGSASSCIDFATWD